MNIQRVDLHRIDLNLLIAFDALMTERSVTRAGIRIGRSQPAMSAALARLRALIGDDLFVRAPHGLQPTPRAIDLAEPLAQALAQIERALGTERVFDPATATTAISLGISDHPGFLMLPRLLDRLRRDAPGMALHIRDIAARDDAIAMLDAGTVDIAVGVPPTATGGGRILHQRLFRERFVCVLRKDHPAAQAPLDLAVFLTLSHLLVSPEGDQFGQVDAALARRGLKRHLALTLPHMYAAPLLVARSDLIATLMEGMVMASGHADAMVMLPPPLDLPAVPFVMSWHRRNDTHPGQHWLRGRIAALGDAGRDHGD